MALIVGNPLPRTFRQLTNFNQKTEKMDPESHDKGGDRTQLRAVFLLMLCRAHKHACNAHVTVINTAGLYDGGNDIVDQSRCLLEGMQDAGLYALAVRHAGRNAHPKVVFPRLIMDNNVHQLRHL
jgi:hypothetical protein